MKHLIFLLGGLFISFCALAQKEMSLEEAFRQKLIEYQFQGDDGSTHYHRPLKGKIINKSNKKLLIWIKSGTYFRSEPADYQDIVITRDTPIALEKKARKSLALYGVCVEASMSSPSAEIKYTLAPLPKPEYQALAQFTNEKKYYGFAETQEAFWVLSDGADLLNVYGHHLQASKDLIAFVANLKGVEVPPIEKAMSHYQVNDNGEIVQDYTRAPKSEMSGRFFFQTRKNTEVLIGMFNDQGILVREIYNNPECAAGNHTIRYAFDSTIYTEAQYHFKLITNGRVWLTMSTPRR